MENKPIRGNKCNNLKYYDEIDCYDEKLYNPDQSKDIPIKEDSNHEKEEIEYFTE